MRLRLPGFAAVLLLLAGCATMTGAPSTTVDDVSRALGATGLNSMVVTASGTQYALGQSHAPGAAWPRFAVKSWTRSVNYQTGSLRDELVRTQALDPPRGGGQQPIRGEQRQNFAVSGDLAWNVAADAAVPAPLNLAERQFNLWSTPHGIVKAVQAGRGTLSGRTITFAMPGRFTGKAFVDSKNLIERVEATLPHPVVGDLPVEIRYSDYQDFGGVWFPTRIVTRGGGFDVLDLTVTDVRPHAPVNITVPETARQAAGFYARVTSQMVADGVWYLTGGTHHSVAIEMKDHVIVVEGPLNDERALGVIAEVRRLVSKPVRYVVNSHHHYDHSGGLRAFAGEGVTVVTHEANRAFFERALAAPATVSPDHLAKSGKKATVEAVGPRRVLTDGARTVEIHHIAGNLHHDGMLMVYLPKERLLIQADAFTPGPAGAPPPSPANPFSVNLADNIARLGLAVNQLLPLHGRVVPLAELHKAIGRSQ